MDGVVMLEAVYVRINETEGPNRMEKRKNVQ